MNRWYCKNCLEYRDSELLQCYCGSWKNNNERLKYISSSPKVFKAINVLNKSFKIPRNDEEVINCEILNDFIYEFNNQRIRNIRKGEFEEKLKILGYWIIEYLGCVNSDTLFHINYVGAHDNEKNAGVYDNKSFFGYKNISINIKPDYSVETIIYTVAHECMHKFLFHNKIVLENEMENEILTDIAVIYFGFGLFLEKGSEGHYERNGFQYHYKVGYLERNEIEIAQSYINNRYWQFQNYKRIVLEKRILLLETRINELKRSIKKTQGLEIEREDMLSLIEYSNKLKECDIVLNTINHTAEIMDYSNKKEIEKICDRADKLLDELKKQINNCKRIIGEPYNNWKEMIEIYGLNRYVTQPENYYKEIHFKSITAEKNGIKNIISDNISLIIPIGGCVAIVLLALILLIIYAQ